MDCKSTAQGKVQNDYLPQTLVFLGVELKKIAKVKT